MRLIITCLVTFAWPCLAPAAFAQVSTDDGGGISAVRDPGDIPPGRQTTEAPGGDGAEIEDLNAPSDEDSGDRSEISGQNSGVRGGATNEAELDDFNTDPRQSDRQRARSGPRRGGQLLPNDGAGRQAEAALGSRTAQSRSPRARRGAANAPRGGRRENRWRYEFYNGYWWYWTPDNRWAFYSGERWIDYNSELANQWARGGAVGTGTMGLGGGGYGLGTSYGGVSGMSGVTGGRRGTQSFGGLGGLGGLGTDAGALGGGRTPGTGSAPGRTGIPGYRSRGGSMAAGGLGPTGAGGSLGGGAGGAVTGEGVGSSLFGNSGGMAAVPGLSGTRGSLGGASGVGITAGSGRSGDAGSGVGGGMVGGAGIGGTGGTGVIGSGK